MQSAAGLWCKSFAWVTLVLTLSGCGYFGKPTPDAILPPPGGVTAEAPPPPAPGAKKAKVPAPAVTSPAK